MDWACKAAVRKLLAVGLSPDSLRKPARLLKGVAPDVGVATNCQFPVIEIVGPPEDPPPPVLPLEVLWAQPPAPKTKPQSRMDRQEHLGLRVGTFDLLVIELLILSRN